MKIKILTTGIFLTLLTIGSMVHFFFASQFEELPRENSTIIVEGEVLYPYHLPIKNGITLREAIFEFGVTSSSDLDDLYIKVSHSWYEIGGDYVIQEDERFKVGTK